MNRTADKAAITVNEIFKSIQGESSWAGWPCVFVRLTGCGLRCEYCDTTYAYAEGVNFSIGEILAKARSLGGKLVELTGGEPLLQENCPLLAQALLDDGWTVLVETSGALPLDLLPPKAIKIMDLKCPGSGMVERNDWENIARLSQRDEVKFVIRDRADFDWAKEVVQRDDLAKVCKCVLFASVHGELAPSQLAEWILTDNLNVRLQLQLHKYLWPDRQRGV